MDFEIFWQIEKERNAQTFEILCFTEEDAKMISLALKHIEKNQDRLFWDYDPLHLKQYDEKTYELEPKLFTPISHFCPKSNEVWGTARSKEYAFDMLSFFEHYKDHISEVHMTGVNAFKPEYSI